MPAAPTNVADAIDYLPAWWRGFRAGEGRALHAILVSRWAILNVRAH